ncbi:MAG: hypothetical protein Q8L34_04405 [Candidatus Woesearchaeota archaeon]|nr:hypothetical protein [Candidatus Woesearchaeota archaeon]
MAKIKKWKNLGKTMASSFDYYDEYPMPTSAKEQKLAVKAILSGVKEYLEKYTRIVIDYP